MTPNLPPVLPGFSEPVMGPLKNQPEPGFSSEDIAIYSGPEYGWEIGSIGDSITIYSLRLGSAIARANGIGGEDHSIERVAVQIKRSGKTFLRFQPNGYDFPIELPVITSGSRDASGAWTWNGSIEAPTLRPSIRTDHGSSGKISHLWLNDGQCQYLEDSTDGFAGQTLPLLTIGWQCDLGDEGEDHDYEEKSDSSGEVDGFPGNEWSFKECRVCGKTVPCESESPKPDEGIQSKPFGEVWVACHVGKGVSCIGKTEADAINGVRDALETHEMKPTPPKPEGETPRTDAFFTEDRMGYGYMDAINLARSIERELTEARKMAADRTTERDHALRDRYKWKSDLAAARAENERLTGLVEYAKQHGLIVGRVITTDRPEGYLAHDYREGSTLQRIFCEWSGSIGQDAEIQRLRAALEAGRLAIGEHFAPNDCYSTGPLTGDPIRDLVCCPACAFIADYDALSPASSGKGEG